jgi:hypothetical protein
MMDAITRARLVRAYRCEIKAAQRRVSGILDEAMDTHDPGSMMVRRRAKLGARTRKPRIRPPSWAENDVRPREARTSPTIFRAHKPAGPTLGEVFGLRDQVRDRFEAALLGGRQLALRVPRNNKVRVRR